MLSSHLRLGLPSGLFTSGLPTKTRHKPLLSAIRIFSNIRYGNCTYAGNSMELNCSYKCVVAKLLTLLGASNVVSSRKLLTL
jgi:hypothetical protein